jgi:hypothetical protein
MTLPGPVDDNAPFIGGFCFDETYCFPADQVNRMAETGKLFITDFPALDSKGEAHRYGGILIAEDWTAAQQEAARRGLGETVLGQFCGVVK